MADFTYIVSLKGSIKVLTYTGLQPRTGGGLTLPDANVDADESSDVEFFPGAAKVKKPAATDSVEGGIYKSTFLADPGAGRLTKTMYFMIQPGRTASLNTVVGSTTVLNNRGGTNVPKDPIVVPIMAADGAVDAKVLGGGKRWYYFKI